MTNTVDETCVPGNNGSITVSVVGGTPPYDFIRNFEESLAEQKQASFNKMPEVISAPGSSSKSYSKGVDILLPESQESPNNVRFNEQGQTTDDAVENLLGFSPRLLSSSSCPHSLQSPRISLDYERKNNSRSSSIPNVIQRSPLDCSKINRSPLVAEKLSPNKKGESFSPRSRTITQEAKIISHQVNPRSLHKSSNKLENDDWIAELPYVTKEIKSFNKSLTKFLKKHMEKRGTSKPDFNQIKEEFKSEVKILFDRTLTKGTNQSIKRSPSINGANSPRSQDYMKNVMTQIQKSEILTRRITSCIIKMKEGLVLYLEENKQKTDWAMNLANLLSYLIHYKKDLTKFMEHLDGVTDRETVELMQNYVEKGLQNFLRQYANERSYELLEKDYGVICVKFLDMQTIAEQVHNVPEPEDALIKFTEIEMKKITEEFKSHNDLCLTRLTINKVSVDTKGLIGGGEGALKRFYTEFLCTFYQQSQRNINRQNIEDEVEKILKNENVSILIKEVLSLCVIPWKEFIDPGPVPFAHDHVGAIHIQVR
ncbi:MAG: SprB repeat-containing protein, partial [Bacteroidota bacterium]